MKIPKIISKNKNEYIFIKKCNENMFLYKDMLYGYTECFSRFDLGLVKEILPPPRTDVNPERVKI